MAHAFLSLNIIRTLVWTITAPRHNDEAPLLVEACHLFFYLDQHWFLINGAPVWHFIAALPVRRGMIHLFRKSYLGIFDCGEWRP